MAPVCAIGGRLFFIHKIPFAWVIRHDLFSTPRCRAVAAVFLVFQLPVFDASKEGFGIQDSVVRILKKIRRQKPVVRQGEKKHHEEHEAHEAAASETGSSARPATF
jgi:hypothetical protein